MSDASSFQVGAFPGLYHSPEDEIHPWDSTDFRSQQGMLGSLFSLNAMDPHMNHTNPSDVYDYVGQGLPVHMQFGGYALQDDPPKNGHLRVDTRVPTTPRLHMSTGSPTTMSAGSMMPITPNNLWEGDRHLQVHVPPITPSSPSGASMYTGFPPMGSKGMSPMPSPMSPHSPFAMGSSDEASSHVFDDDDEEDAPQPMEHIVQWKAIRENAVIATGTGIYIPQSIYQPYTEADRVRYIKKANLKEPIIFKTSHPDQWGISLEDALRARMKDLDGRDDQMFVDCGPSVSIRLQWPGYRAWTKQIPTMDFKSPKCPITRGKLAKNVANCVKRFIEEKEKERMESDVDRRWKVGKRFIRMEDLILVSLHHISKGSWQPQLRLRTEMGDIQQRRASLVASSGV